MNKEIDPKLFEQPGFLSLFNAWCDALERNNSGDYVLSTKKALARVEDAWMQAQITDSIGGVALKDLENTACQCAQEVIVQANEVEYEL